MLDALAQPNPPEQIPAALDGWIDGHAGHARGQTDILDGIELGKEMVGLEDETHLDVAQMGEGGIRKLRHPFAVDGCEGREAHERTVLELVPRGGHEVLVAADPGELHNLAGYESHALVAARLRERLHVRMAAAGEAPARIISVPTHASGQRRIMPVEIDQ